MKRKLVVVLVLIIMLLSAGCNAMQLIEEDDVKADVETIVEAIETEDTEFIYTTYFENKAIDLERDEVEKGMNQISGIYKGEMLSTEFYNINVRSFNGETTKEVVYLIKTTESAYYIKLTYLKDAYGKYNIIGININEFLDYVVNSKISDYTFKNWVLLTLNLVSYGIMILALILCIKTKVKLKPLWIILILIQVGVTITDFPNTYQINYSFIQLLGISQYLLYAHGGTFTNVFIHIFAIVFLIIRKPLMKKYDSFNDAEYKRIKAERDERKRILQEEQAKVQEDNSTESKEDIKADE